MRNDHKISPLMNFSDTKTLKYSKPKKETLGGGRCKFCALLDQSANTKVKEHLKPTMFHIGGFTSGIVEFGPICKKHPMHIICLSLKI